MQFFFISDRYVSEFLVKRTNFDEIKKKSGMVGYSGEFQEAFVEAMEGDVLLDGSVGLEDEEFLVFGMVAEVSEAADARVAVCALTPDGRGGESWEDVDGGDVILIDVF